jgi:hypothetical protein
MKRILSLNMLRVAPVSTCILMNMDTFPSGNLPIVSLFQQIQLPNPQRGFEFPYLFWALTFKLLLQIKAAGSKTLSPQCRIDFPNRVSLTLHYSPLDPLISILSFLICGTRTWGAITFGLLFFVAN